MLTIKEAADLQKSHHGKKTTQISALEMSLAAGVELACWKLANPKAVSVSADASRVWKAIELLGWPSSENFARAQKGNLVLQRLPTEANNNNWTALKMEFMKALRTNGFSNTLSSRLTGALAELTNNVWDHSERTDTGLLGFQVQNRKFTIVIADLGIGILESLRRNPQHSSTRTHSAAIEKALVPGVSRFEDISRGTGFIDFLSVVTDLHGKARLRTGNIALTIDHTQENEIRTREYLIDFPGFQVFLYGALS